MKNLFILALIITTLANMQKVDAIVVTCTNCAVSPVQLADRVTGLMSQANQFLNTNANILSYTNEFILGPIADQIKAQIVNIMSKETANWISGGFQGKPSFVTNPDRLYQGVENTAVKIALNDINKNGGNIFSESALSGIIGGIRNERAPINERTVYTLASTIQKNMCSDDNISDLALRDVTSNLNMTKEQAIADTNIRPKYEARKKEIYSSLCTGDALSDKAVQQKLSSAFKNDFNNGGWDAWNDLTGNQNNTGYGNVQAKKEIVKTQVETKKSQTQEETKQGNGYLGIKTCTKEVFLDTEGITECEKWETKTPGQLVSESAVKASYSNLDNLINTQSRNGSVLISFVTATLASLIDKGFSSVVSDVTSGLKDDLGDSFGKYVKPTVSGNTPVNKTTTFANLDKIDPESKSKITDPMIKTLNDDKNNIASIRSILNYYLSDFTNYENGVKSVSDCYDNIITTTQTRQASLKNQVTLRDYTSDGRYISGKNYSTNAISTANYNVGKVQGDLNNINKLENNIGEITEKINNSDQSTVIISAFTNYQESSQKSALTQMGNAQVVGFNYKLVKDDLDKDTAENMNLRLSECTQLRSEADTEYQSAVNSQYSSGL